MFHQPIKPAEPSPRQRVKRVLQSNNRALNAASEVGETKGERREMQGLKEIEWNAPYDNARNARVERKLLGREVRDRNAGNIYGHKWVSRADVDVEPAPKSRGR